MVNKIALIQKYWDLGGPSLVWRALYSKAKSTLGIHKKSGNKTKIELNGNSYIVSGDWEEKQWHQFEQDVIMPEVTRPMREYLGKGDTLIDVGTARGDTTLYGHSLVGNEGLVYAIEPDVIQFKRLRKNIERNNLKSVDCYNIAVSDRPGEMDPEAVVGQTTEEFQSLLDEMGSIDVTTLDEFVKGREDPDLIKIDVDGAEGAVLRGATESVIGNIPIILEVHSSKYLDNRHEVLQMIFESSNEVQYLAAQTMAPSEYKYGERLSSPYDLDKDVVVNLLVK